MTGRGADAFEVLGLPRDPDLDDGEVRQAYRERLRAVHPDTGGNSECAAAVTAAYDALRSPARRAAAAEEAWLAVDGGGLPGPGVAVTSAAVLERIENLTAGPALDAQVAVAAGPGRTRMPQAAGAPPPARRAAGPGPLLVRVRHGRWWLLAARVVVAAVVPVAAWLAAPGHPAAWAALAVGSATWLARTGRYDLAHGPPR